MSLFFRLGKAGVQSGSIMMLSDSMTQVVLEGRDIPMASNSKVGRYDDVVIKSPPPYDPTRSLRWGFSGLVLHGPYFLLAFGKIDSYWGPVTSLKNVLQKTAMAQFTVFPVYLVLLFGSLGIMEGISKRAGSNNTVISYSEISQKVYQRGTEAFAAGCLFWPVAHIINFTYVPASWRVPYLAACQLPWNCFLSWRNGG